MMKTKWIFIGMLLSIAFVNSATASDKSDEALDAKLGILSKPFVVNLAVLNSRIELRAAASVRTGLPSYDQQVETAQDIPAALIELMETRRRAAEAAQEAASQPAVVEEEPICYTDPNGGIHCE